MSDQFLIEPRNASFVAREGGRPVLRGVRRPWAFLIACPALLLLLLDGSEADYDRLVEGTKVTVAYLKDDPKTSQIVIYAADDLVAVL